MDKNKKIRMGSGNVTICAPDKEYIYRDVQWGLIVFHKKNRQMNIPVRTDIIRKSNNVTLLLHVCERRQLEYIWDRNLSGLLSLPNCSMFISSFLSLFIVVLK